MAGPAQHTLNGDAFLQLVVEGTRYVERHADDINALNVFPVPDGDTGTNMLLTMRAALESTELPAPGVGTVAQVSQALSRGALLGARGNSGVIFSQFMKGISVGLADADECDGADLARAFGEASAAGYQAVGNPVEGTMLTVMRAAAEGTTSMTGSAVDVLDKALRAATVALAYTPEQLPILKEAGVVDSGGQGVVAFLAGALAFASGDDVALEISTPVGGLGTVNVSQEFLEHTEEEMYGFCTQFVVLGEGLNVDDARQRVQAMAGSTVVIGDDRTIRIHAHAEDPGPLLTLGVELGSVDQVSIQNMDVQHQEFMALHGYTQEESSLLAVIPVAPGDGFSRIFKDLGAANVVSGGQTMNPSAGQLLDAVRKANAAHTILLPNNSNIVMAANQAAELSEGRVSVVPTKSVPQGIAAMLAFNPDLDGPANIEAMTAALGGVQGGEVTTAVRSTTIDGVSVEEGQAIALLEGKLVAVGATPNEALLDMLEQAGIEDGSLVTLYHGAGTTDLKAQEAARAIQLRYGGVEVEVLDGGQPHYQYVTSVE
ncbi:MAG: DAK2 domain-containing protein [Chloroflexi bacterium]|nr:DAK2 domain-containing protein [Chloroflexota bacterium]